jgi:hypothetical protein
MSLNTLLQHLRDRIAQDDLDGVLRELRLFLDNSPQLDEVLHHAGRFADIRRQIRLGAVSQEDAERSRNKLRAALLELLREIETQQAESPILREEMAQAISVTNSKNVVVHSTITAGGDVHIGDKHVNQKAEKIYNIEKIDKADFS